MRAWFVAAAVLALCGHARAADAGDEDTASWIVPKIEALKAQWPRDAQGQIIYGKVVLDCAAGLGGFAGDCKVKSSTPADPRLEQAALKLAPLYKAWDPKLSRAVLTVDVRYDEYPYWLTKPKAAQLLDISEALGRVDGLQVIKCLLQSSESARICTSVINNTDQLVIAYPHEALLRGLGGMAVVKCVVQTTGLTRACEVVKEDKPGLGFGTDAAVLSSTFLFKPAVRAGRPVEADVSILIRFSTNVAYDSDQRGGFVAGGAESRIDRNPKRPPSPTLLDVAVWSKAPTIPRILAEMEKKVGDKFADGTVVLHCDLDTKTGRLGKCTVASASPGMAQFSDVAKSLTSEFQADPAALQNQNGSLMVKLAFAFPDMSSPEWDKRYLTHPRWIKTISPDPDKATFPEAAAKAGLKTGSATVDCIAGADGALAQCQVISESPPNLGFGRMAVQIAEAFVANPWDDNGLPVGGAHVRMPIQMDYQPPPEPPAEPPTPATRP